MIAAVSSTVNVPVIVGGGIKSADQARSMINSGADILVVGNAFEKDPSLVIEIANAIHDSGVEVDV